MSLLCTCTQIVSHDLAGSSNSSDCGNCPTRCGTKAHLQGLPCSRHTGKWTTGTSSDCFAYLVCRYSHCDVVKWYTHSVITSDTLLLSGARNYTLPLFLIRFKQEWTIELVSWLGFFVLCFAFSCLSLVCAGLDLFPSVSTVSRMCIILTPMAMWLESTNGYSYDFYDQTWLLCWILVPLKLYYIILCLPDTL